MVAYTPTQRRIMDVLADGQLHEKRDLMSCLYEDNISNLGVHLAYLRRKLRALGQDIICERTGSNGACYRLVSHIQPAI
jgi:hypothetical protein